MNPSTGHFSAIDLSLSSTSLGQRVLWSVLPKIYDSDHIPILMEILTSHNPDKTIPAKWKLKNPDWAFFNQLVEHNLENYSGPKLTIEDKITYITESITKAANIAIGKTNQKIKYTRVPWRNTDIKDSIKKKNIALKIFQRSGKLDDFITLKQLRAKTRYLVKSSKTNSWKTFTSNIDSRTDPKLVWNKIRALRGQNNEKQIHIIIDNQLNTDPTTVAYTIGEYFHKNSSDNNYAKGFIEKYRNQRNQQSTSIVNPYLEEQIYLNTSYNNLYR